MGAPARPRLHLFRLARPEKKREQGFYLRTNIEYKKTPSAAFDDPRVQRVVGSFPKLIEPARP
jgi:hypothetical protein